MVILIELCFWTPKWHHNVSSAFKVYIFLQLSPADFFVIDLTNQLQKLKVEPVLLHHLSQLRVLQGVELRMATSTRLKTCLYSFTSPVGPMYPTRAVRHATWDALDFLFPLFQASLTVYYLDPLRGDIGQDLQEFMGKEIYEDAEVDEVKGEWVVYVSNFF
ncbi:hypothetical protein Patl1_18646 [Pistacia atlantica]|uniref:Uncharacterized protein n=1 Tax=Pistacia atlantica TaxID=434234 RepID=A0ACC1C0R3_9ROSI|nr:hypothetical protein Patl1_18646 [Pistacia atlantica]